MPEFFDRKSESRRVQKAILEGRSLLISGPAGIGKTTLVSTVTANLPPDWKERCLEIHGAKDLRDLLRHLVMRLYQAEDLSLRRLLRSQGIASLNSPGVLKRIPTSGMKGIVYRALEEGSYRIFLDHLPSVNRAVAQVIKELSWMRHTPVYLLVRDDAEQHVDRLCRFFYWGEQERCRLPPLPRRAAADLVESCVERVGLNSLQMSDFQRHVLKLSRQIPGTIVEMCRRAAEPRRKSVSRLTAKAAYIDFLMRGSASGGGA